MNLKKLCQAFWYYEIFAQKKTNTFNYSIKLSYASKPREQKKTVKKLNLIYCNIYYGLIKTLHL